MDKSNLKKLALMGMTGGMLIAAQSPANETTTCVEGQTVLSAKCGGGGKCGGYSANNPQPQRPSQAHCGAQQPNRRLMADAQTEVQTQQMSGKMVGQDELYNQLNDEGKAIWRGLDEQGKALALKFASQDNIKNKNDAVKMAAQTQAEMRAKGSYHQ